MEHLSVCRGRSRLGEAEHVFNFGVLPYEKEYKSTNTKESFTMRKETKTDHTILELRNATNVTKSREIS